MTKITYVTAYLDIGRGKWNRFGRSFDTYLDHFLPLIELIKKDNEEKSSISELILYIDEKYFEKIILNCKEILNFCTLIKINLDFMKGKILWNRLEKERSILQSEEYKIRFHHRLHFPENSIAEYTLINHSKIDFVCDAIQRTNSDYFCWMDFGYFQDKNRIPSSLLDLNKLDLDRINYTYK